MRNTSLQESVLVEEIPQNNHRNLDSDSDNDIVPETDHENTPKKRAVRKF